MFIFLLQKAVPRMTKRELRQDVDGWIIRIFFILLILSTKMLKVRLKGHEYLSFK